MAANLLSIVILTIVASVSCRNWYGLSEWTDPITREHFTTCNVSIGCFVKDKDVSEMSIET